MSLGWRAAPGEHAEVVALVGAPVVHLRGSGVMRVEGPCRALGPARAAHVHEADDPLLAEATLLAAGPDRDHREDAECDARGEHGDRDDCVHSDHDGRPSPAAAATRPPAPAAGRAARSPEPARWRPGGLPRLGGTTAQASAAKAADTPTGPGRPRSRCVVPAFVFIATPFLCVFGQRSWPMLVAARQPARPPRLGALGGPWWDLASAVSRSRQAEIGRRRLSRAAAGASPARDKLGRLAVATVLWPPGVACPSGVQKGWRPSCSPPRNPGLARCTCRYPAVLAAAHCCQN